MCILVILSLPSRISVKENLSFSHFNLTVMVTHRIRGDTRVRLSKCSYFTGSLPMQIKLVFVVLKRCAHLSELCPITNECAAEDVAWVCLQCTVSIQMCPLATSCCTVYIEISYSGTAELHTSYTPLCSFAWVTFACKLVSLFAFPAVVVAYNTDRSLDAWFLVYLLVF